MSIAECGINKKDGWSKTQSKTSWRLTGRQGALSSAQKEMIFTSPGSTDQSASIIQSKDKVIEDELGNEMDDSFLGTLRGINRKHFHEIWKKAQSGELQGLNEEEQHLGKIMLDHSDEYFNQFEFADALADHEYDPETEVNPFLHVILHVIAEKQVEDRDPIEAFQFYNAMLRNKCSRHEAIHLLNIILVKFIFQILKEKKPFPLESYRKILKEYKSRNPKKINQLVEDIQFDERVE